MLKRLVNWFMKADVEGMAKFHDGQIIKDQDVANFVFKHLRIRDMVRPGKVVSAALAAFAMFADGSAKDVPENWKWTDL